MAKATKDVIQAQIKVILTLSKEEALALLAVLSKVGGNPKTSRRGLTQAVYNALYNMELGFKELESTDLRTSTTGLWFDESEGRQ
jgi:hypothetical protein